VFERFAQVDDSTGRRFSGSGLGLAIVRSLVELMGGDISLSSELGMGTTIRVDLKIPPARDRGSSRFESRERLAGRVLLLESNEEQRAVVAEILALLSEGVDAYGDALEARRAFERQRDAYALLVVDEGFGEDLGPLFPLADPGVLGAERPSLPVVRLVGEYGDGGGRSLSGGQLRLRKPLIEREVLDLFGRLGGAGLPQSTPFGRRPEPEIPTSVEPSSRLLLVEDNRHNRMLASKILSHAGHSVDEAIDGRHGLQRFREHDYDLVLLDIEMPGIDGFETCGLMRSAEAETDRARTPIVALTAHALEGFRERCLEAGMDDYLTKPIHPPEVLLGCVRRFIGGRAAEVEPGSAVGAPDVVEVDPEIASLVPGYLEEVCQEARKIADLARQGDLAEAGRIGHQLKGSGAGYGFPRITELGMAIERAGVPGGNVDTVLAHAQQLQDFAERVRIVERMPGRPRTPPDLL
jgi:CheY-like chemotaxis protein